MSRDTAVGFGKRYPELWLNRRPDRVPMAPDFGAHLCLRAPDEAAVRSFFETALALGCAGAGDPGPRRASMNPYFGAFIFDPDGNKLEAATFPRPE